MFESIVGQNKVKTQLSRAIQAAKIGQTLLPHFLLASGTGGTGKTLFVNEVAKEMNCSIVVLNANDCTSTHLMPVLMSSPSGILFLEEWNSKNDSLDFALRPYLENGVVLVNNVAVEPPSRLTVAIATNNISIISQPLASRLRHYQMEDYTPDELVSITRYHASLLKLSLDDRVVDAVTSRSRGVPREIVKVLRVLQEHTLVYCRAPTLDETLTIMEEMGIYDEGFNSLDLKIMNMLASARELSLSAICGATGESMETIRLHESFLIRKGMLTIKTRRMLTREGYEFLVRHNYATF